MNTWHDFTLRHDVATSSKHIEVKHSMHKLQKSPGWVSRRKVLRFVSLNNYSVTAQPSRGIREYTSHILKVAVSFRRRRFNRNLFFTVTFQRCLWVFASVEDFSLTYAFNKILELKNTDIFFEI